MNQNHSRHENLQQLRKLATLLDSKFQGPFGFRFGIDALLGFIPGIGDLTTAGMSTYILIQGAKIGCPPAILIRMAINIAIDNVVAIVPVFGRIYDFFWKSNNKNLALIEAHMRDPNAVKKQSRGVVALVLGIFILTLCAIFWGGYLLVELLWKNFS